MRSVTDILNELGVKYRGSPARSFKTLCPHCSHTRKHKDDPCLSVRVDSKGVGIRCFNCSHTDGRYYDDVKFGTSGMVGKPGHQHGSSDKYGALLRQARSNWR